MTPRQMDWFTPTLLVGAFVIVVIFLVWATKDCTRKALAAGGTKGILTRDAGCLIEMGDGTLRRAR